MTTALIAIAAAALMFGIVVDTPERHERRMRLRNRLPLPGDRTWPKRGGR